MVTVKKKPTKTEKTTKVRRLEAKAKFLTYCREVLDKSTPVHIKDIDGTAFMVLDYKERRTNGSPLVDISAQFFKDNFSRCTSLVRDGVCFRLTLRGRNAAVIARRHTEYVDPMDEILAIWREKVVESAFKPKTNADVLQAVSDLALAQKQGKDDIEERLKGLARAIVRLSIGHRPFEDGEMLPGVLKLYRDEEPSAAA